MVGFAIANTLYILLDKLYAVTGLQHPSKKHLAKPRTSEKSQTLPEGEQVFKVPLPGLGEGFRVRANKGQCSLFRNRNCCH